MLEHVLLRYSNETLNGYCYVNIPLEVFYFAIRQLEKRLGAWGIICNAIDNNALLLGLVSSRV